MVEPLEESISNIFSYDKKHISHDRSILCGSSVVEFCHRFAACVVQYNYKGAHCTEGRYQATNQEAACVQSALFGLKRRRLCIGIFGRNFPFVFYLYVSKVVNLWTLPIS
jgi:hypothetical protein